MDRALDPRLLAGALGDLRNLPSPLQLREMLAAAEVGAFFRGDDPVEAPLLGTAWTLHHIGTARRALGLYGADRQVQANAVAAHVFDLAMRDEDTSAAERLVLTFAAQVSSIRGDRAPNASALARRLPPSDSVVHLQPGRTSLELGCALLGLQRKFVVGFVRDLRGQLRDVASRFDLQDLRESGLAAVVDLVEGVRWLLRYLTDGNREDLDTAQSAFLRAANPTAARRDLDSRWVAAHLYDLTEDFGATSVWALLPEGTPPAVGRTMTLGDPPVMTLWPPQITLLKNNDESPLNQNVRRAVLTFPTSAGKTLLTQLVIAAHVATRNTGVCVVAPTHSLCREIRRGLQSRLWPVRRQIVDDGPLGMPGSPRAPVVVMTPEKLAARLRASEADLLSDFELFVLDEAHLVSDRGRGWTFETTIARLHELTTRTSHRLILVSAALGGTASVQTWLDVAGASISATEKWRGPRRLHATYASTRGRSRTVAATGRQRLPRDVSELHGVVRLFVDQGSAVAERSAPLGEVVQVGRSAPVKPSVAAQLRPLIDLAVASGPVLTVHATKRSAERLALEVAEHREVSSATEPLVNLASLRLHDTHPLVNVLRKGVAYHHAALPTDVQAEIEDAVRAGAIDIVCGTTTLTEGVNLPVKTVIVAERGYNSSEGFQLQLQRADLLNAAGRAGRAGRETEAWVIIVHQPNAPNARSALLSLDQDEDVYSTLASTNALAALADYEELLSSTAGLVLSDVPPEVDDFLSYCWYLADAAGSLAASGDPAQVLSGLRHTLAWQQLNADFRARWEQVAERAATEYAAADVLRRRRWARTGARLSANAVLERVAASAGIAARGLNMLERYDPRRVADVVLGDGRLDELLQLVDERDRRFKRRRHGRTELVDVDTKALVMDWLSGVLLSDLAETHLAEVEEGDDDGFRHEQLSRFLASVCEHHLPWTLGIVLEWIRETERIDLFPDLPAHLHHGVRYATALAMMLGGVRSRRLAQVVGKAALAAGIDVVGLRRWLTDMGAPGWRREFDAGAAEVADLLQFVQDPQARVSAELLEGRTLTIAADLVAAPVTADLRIDYLPTEERPAPLGALDSSGELVASLRPSEHHDLAVLVDAGFRLAGRIQGTHEHGTDIEIWREDE